jgi:hypothetical protein
MSDDTTECACGHVRDEHDPNTKGCTVPHCDCFHLDRKEHERQVFEDQLNDKLASLSRLTRKLEQAQTHQLNLNVCAAKIDRLTCENAELRAEIGRICYISELEPINEARNIQLTTRVQGLERENAELRAKLTDATKFCSGEFPCEASTSAASLERERNDLKAHVVRLVEDFTRLLAIYEDDIDPGDPPVGRPAWINSALHSIPPNLREWVLVGEACLFSGCAVHLHYDAPCTCVVCHGTGRIRTAPAGKVNMNTGLKYSLENIESHYIEPEDRREVIRRLLIILKHLEIQELQQKTQ